MVWNNVLKLFTNADLIKKQAKRWTDSKIKEVEYSEDDVLRNEKLLKKMEEEEARYIKAYGAGVLTLGQFQERLSELKDRKFAISAVKEGISEQKVKPVIDFALIDNLPQKFSSMLQSLEFEEKQLFLRDVLSQVIVGDGREVSVKGAIPLESEAQNNGFWTESRDRWIA